MGDIPYYPDTGCNLSPSCLECHLPACKYDDPGVVPNKQARGERDSPKHTQHLSLIHI